MTLFYQILGFLSFVFAIVMTGVMLVTFRKPRRVTALSALVSVLISLALLPIYLALSGVNPDPRLALPIFSLGLLVGFLRGQTTKLEYVGDDVVGKHSLFFLVLWGASLAISQLLSMFDSVILLAVGLSSLFFSTGTQAGIYGNWFLRRLVMVPTRDDIGGAESDTFQRLVPIIFGGLTLIFLLESLLLGIPVLTTISSADAGGFEDIAFEDFQDPAADVTVFDEEGGTLPTEVTPTPEPYFNGEQFLIWTRPLAVFMVEGPFDLYDFNADGSGFSNIYGKSISMILGPPYLSPDGQLWVFRSERNGTIEEYLMTVDGTHTYQLEYEGSPTTIGDWSPDWSQVVVESEARGNEDILLTDREGMDWRVLTEDPASDTDPRWSPDGKSTLFLSNRDGNKEIYRLDLDEEEVLINLSTHPGEDKRAEWAEGGTRIVFTSDRNGELGIYSMDRDGGDLRKIVADPNCGFAYRLSPAGTRLIYYIDEYYDNVIRGKEGCESKDTYVGTVMGGEGVLIKDAGGPSSIWSPDSRQIAFAGPGDIPDSFLGYPLSDIYLVNADGTGLINLTQSVGDEYKFAWSPDSSRIGYIASESQENAPTLRKIMIINTDGSAKTELAREPFPSRDDVPALEGYFWP